MNERPGNDEEVVAELVAFFHALGAEKRRAYDALAEADRRWGEDVDGELRARGAS